MQNNSYSNDECLENEDVLDFRPYGLIIGKDITQEEVDNLIEEQIRSIKDEPPILQNELLLGHTINTKGPIKDIQTKIKYVLNNLKFYYNKLAIHDKIENQIEEMKNGFGRCSFRINMLDDVRIEEKNPFYWTVHITHELPARPYEITDEMYNSLYLQDTRLYGKLLIMVYQKQDKNEDKNEDKIEDKDKSYVIFVSRSYGRSPAYNDCIHFLKDIVVM